jgi:hypothetical protein
VERDPNHPAGDIDPNDATPSGAEGGNGAPAPLHTPDDDPKPVEERLEDEADKNRPGDT